MKVTAYLVVSRGYKLVISASQWIDELLENCDEHNREYHGEGWRQEVRDRAVVTVEFELPDSVFDPSPPPPTIQGTLLKKKGES